MRIKTAEEIEAIKARFNEVIESAKSEYLIIKGLLDEDKDENTNLLQDTIETTKGHLEYLFSDLEDECMEEVYMGLLSVLYEYYKDKWEENFKDVFKEWEKAKIMYRKYLKGTERKRWEKYTKDISLKTLDENFDEIYEKFSKTEAPLFIKPIKQIQQDIGTIEKYQKMIHRLYGAKSKIDDTYALFNAPKEIKENYSNNKKLLNDLQSQKFKIISKLNYYEFEKHTKQPIRDYLLSVKTEYKLKMPVLNIKNYIDSL